MENKQKHNITSKFGFAIKYVIAYVTHTIICLRRSTKKYMPEIQILKREQVFIVKFLTTEETHIYRQWCVTADPAKPDDAGLLVTVRH